MQRIKSIFNLPLKNQKGAMFGLDARVAIAMMGAIAVMTGGFYFVNIYTARGYALVDELRGLGLAIDGYQYDLKDDLQKTITTPNGRNEVLALIQTTPIKSNYVSHWKGPYYNISEDRKIANSGSAISLRKAADQTGAPCTDLMNCHYWVVIEDFPEASVDIMNTSIDGSNENMPATQGALRWVNGSQSKVTLWYMASSALAR